MFKCTLSIYCNKYLKVHEIFSNLTEIYIKILEIKILRFIFVKTVIQRTPMPSKNYLNWPNFILGLAHSTFFFSPVLSVLREIYSKRRMLVEIFDRFSSMFKKQTSKTKWSRSFEDFLFSPFLNAVYTINVYNETKKGGGNAWNACCTLDLFQVLCKRNCRQPLAIFSRGYVSSRIGRKRNAIVFPSSRITLFRPIVLYSCRGGDIRRAKRERKENFKISNFQFNLVQLCFRSPPRHQPLKNALDMPTRRVKAGLENRSPSVLLSPPYPHLPLCNSRHG